MIGRARRYLVGRLLAGFDRLLEKSRDRIWRAARPPTAATPPAVAAALSQPAPYHPAPRPAVDRSALFITARFRSGSTFLWNLFRRTPACTAYYEPLNERRWFEEPKTIAKGEWVDPTHRGVDDYRREYAGMSDLTDLYREDWTVDDLHMDAAAWNP
ncbi:MAG: hypothetical protein ACRC1K_27100, partial [Planctomycetia bacterium]